MKKLILLSITFLASIAGISQGCLPEGITFSTQQQIDDFQINYPGCTEIEGDVTISGDDIENLNGLNVITSIYGDLRIYGNMMLQNLSGLDSISSIGGGLIISGNWSIVSFENLSNLSEIGGGLQIRANFYLESLSGLENIDPSSITDLEITSNGSLSECEIESICTYLSNPNGEVDIFYNSSGCNSITDIAYSCGTSLPCLPYGNYHFYLQSEIDSFQYDYENCTELNGYVNIVGEYIYNLNGLDIVTNVEKDLIIGTTSLSNLSGLDNLVSIGETLEIGSNNNLTGFEGLNSLNTIGEDIHIVNNYSLSNLNSLINLNSVGELFTIYGNDELLSLSGLDNVDFGSMISLSIFDNLSLSTCNIESVCEYLMDPNGIYIDNNAPGCNTIEEIEDSCLTATQETTFKKNNFKIFPNPTKKTITIESTSKIEAVSIFNQTGQKNIEIASPQNKIDVSTLQPGLYYIEVKTEFGIVREKLIIR